MWQEIAPWLLQSGGLGIIAWAVVSLHRSAIRSEARRADAWERIAMLREGQIAVLLGGPLAVAPRAPAGPLP